MGDVVTLFRDYMGVGLIVLWFLLALLYLFLKEKRRHLRILFVWVPVILLLVFFNPLFARLVFRMADGEIYYRILWLLPMTTVIAWAATEIYGSLRGRGRFVFAGAAAVMLMVSQNPYHIPQSVVDICDAIRVEGREVRAVFPAEMLQYVRQYDGTVCMPYGREVIVERWNVLNELYFLMEAEEVDAVRLAELARERVCHYIILSGEKRMAGSLTDCSFEVFGQIDGYTIYRDSTADLSLPAAGQGGEL